jgi:S-DNA-T family DNA segregation ATPase FtsK/SpoIIIE
LEEKKPEKEPVLQEVKTEEPKKVKKSKNIEPAEPEFVINRAEMPDPFIQEEVVSPEPAEEPVREVKKTKLGAKAVASAVADVEAEMSAESEKPKKVYQFPPINLLTKGKKTGGDSDSHLKETAMKLQTTLHNFGVNVTVTNVSCGPSVTRYELQPEQGVKVSKIVGLADDIKLNLAAADIRIEAPIPGKAAVGIEVPNKERAIVSFKELIETETAAYKKMAIPVVLGKDITGEAQLLDLAKTPHLLIAGSTGSGKSVCVNSMILSILYKRSPNDVKLILIDPKVVELKLYNDIPHLLTPVITEPKKAFQALQYCLCEMERRYALLDGMGVRDITSFNHRIEERNIATEKLPYIVVVIDEFADLMATTGKELESVVARLAAMSRAVGIHLVLATQRPSIDVITGLIKANIPTRIAFMVASKMDSRIIIDQVGAEKLLGRGDMLYASATDPFPVRIQGTYVSDNEVENVVDYVKQYGEPEYIDDEIFVEDDDEVDVGPNLFGEGEDPLYNKALEIVIQAGKASASYIQRRLKIGYNRAARLVEEMEARGIVGPANGSKPREIIHIP